MKTPSFFQFLLLCKIFSLSPLLTNPVISVKGTTSSSKTYSWSALKPVNGFVNNSLGFSGYSNKGTGSFPLSISDLFAKGTHPKFTKIECSLGGLIVELISLSYLILAVTKGANTK